MFIKGFEKIADAATVIGDFEEYLKKTSPSSLKKFHDEADLYTQRGHKWSNQIQSEYKKFLKWREANIKKEYEENVNLPKNKLTEGLKGMGALGLLGGSLGLLGGAVAGPKGSLIGAGIGAGAGGIVGYRLGRSNPYYKMTPDEFQQLQKSYRKTLPEL